LTAENETLRWPTNLDHAAIVKRLVEVRAAAQAAGLAQLAAGFDAVETMPAGRLASAVVAALTSIQEAPEHRAIAMQLEMVAINLKNLR
jgi:hypothetical protein